MENNSLQSPSRRVPLQLDVSYRRSYSRRMGKGRLKNISLTGAFLELTLDQPLSPNDKLLVTILVSGRERKIPANVVWHTHSGCGIQFQPTNNRDVQIVDDLIYYVENSRESQRSVLDNIFKRVS